MNCKIVTAWLATAVNCNFFKIAENELSERAWLWWDFSVSLESCENSVVANSFAFNCVSNRCLCTIVDNIKKDNTDLFWKGIPELPLYEFISLYLHICYMPGFIDMWIYFIIFSRFFTTTRAHIQRIRVVTKIHVSMTTWQCGFSNFSQ